MGIKTAGELRGFLADVLMGIRSGEIDSTEASAIAKIANCINQSLAVEAKAAIEMKRLGGSGDPHVMGSVQIASGDVSGIYDQDKWCDQCEALIAPEDAAQCRSKFCKLRAAA